MLNFVKGFFLLGFSCGSAGKESACMWETWARSLGWEDHLEKGKATHPLQYSGLENSMDSIVHGVAKSQTRLSDFHFLRFIYIYIYMYVCIYIHICVCVHAQMYLCVCTYTNFTLYDNL